MMSRAALERGGLEGKVTGLFKILYRLAITSRWTRIVDGEGYRKTMRESRTVCKFPSGFDAKMAGSQSRTHI
jgi:hypothetical protein